MSIYSIKSYIEGPKVRKADVFLRTLAWDHQCEIKLTIKDISWWTERIDFECTGLEQNLNAFKKDFELSLLKDGLPTYLSERDYKIQSLVEKDAAGESLQFEIKAPKSSKIKDLSERIAEDLPIHCSVSETNNGFLKGKTVIVSAIGPHKDLQAFKILFKDCINASSQKKKKVIPK